MSHKYNFYGHDDGLVIDGPDTRFASRPMTAAELAARDPAKAISEDIYRHANYAGVCYYEIWNIIAKAFQGPPCPACSKPMVEVPFETRHAYTADIQHYRYRCEGCKVTAQVETVFSVDESVPAVGVSDG